MTKKNSLQAVLERSARAGAPETKDTARPPAPPRRRAPPPEPAPEPEAPPARAKRPSREGRRLVAGHFEPAVARQLKLLAAEEDTTVQALLEEALDLLFVKKGRGAIVRG